MAQTFEDILNGLLSELAALSNSDIDVLIAEYSKKLGVSDAGQKDIKTANQLLEKIEENFQILQKAKEEEGISTGTWMARKLKQIGAAHGMNKEEQKEFVENVAEVMQEQTQEAFDEVAQNLPPQ